MKTKTCGECRWFDSSFCLCCRSIEHFDEAYSDTAACEEFEEVWTEREAEDE